jgi:hypothetical protein
MYKVPFPSLKTVKTFLLESAAARLREDVLVNELKEAVLPTGYEEI